MFHKSELKNVFRKGEVESGVEPSESVGRLADWQRWPMSHKGGNILAAKKAGAWNSKQKFPPSLPLDDQCPLLFLNAAGFLESQWDFYPGKKKPLLEKNVFYLLQTFTLQWSWYLDTSLNLIGCLRCLFNVPLCLTISTWYRLWLTCGQHSCEPDDERVGHGRVVSFPSPARHLSTPAWAGDMCKYSNISF